MRVLTVFAHPNPKSFCHAILQRFTKGLEDAGHVTFYRVPVADDDTRREYLERAYHLGREFA